ncbi:MAG TPA: cellulose binding domain-containing protein, partial [Micromonospora sp.]
TLVVRGADSLEGLPGAPGQPTVREMTDRSVTIAWPAATPGRSPIAKYEVYRHNGAVSEQLGETDDTSLTVHNLVPGTRYTVNVLARDTAGRVSWASPPLTFTMGAPTSSTCQVRFTTVTDWGNGYVGTVEIVNNGEEPITGWTFTFTWPTPWQEVSSGWSGTWEQSGTTVRVTSVPDNRHIPGDGGSVTTGFVAAYHGPNVPPGVFRLNGTLCATS